MIKKVVTLDNLRVPFITDGKFKILSFRSRDPVFKADPGVVPDEEMCQKAGVTVVKTTYQHNDLSDRGPDGVKNTIQSILDRFLDRRHAVRTGGSRKTAKQPRPARGFGRSAVAIAAAAANQQQQ